jgi:hypothetical protein
MPKAKPLPDQQRLRALFDYDPSTGVLTWRSRTPDQFAGEHAQRLCNSWNARYAGTAAGSADDGYLKTRIEGESFRCHRIIYKLLTGMEPEEIDHVDGDKSNNRLQNLAPATHSQNMKNVAKKKRDTNRHPGVFLVGRRWHVRVGNNHIGTFGTEQDALAARRNEERKRGFSSNHGRPRHKI